MLVIKSREGEVIDFISDYTPVGPFGVHADRENPKLWSVTHAKTGMTAQGNAFPAFPSKKQAVQYCNILLKMPIDWDFQTETEMRLKNDMEMVKVLHHAANKEARR